MFPSVQMSGFWAKGRVSEELLTSEKLLGHAMKCFSILWKIFLNVAYAVFAEYFMIQKILNAHICVVPFGIHTLAASWSPRVRPGNVKKNHEITDTWRSTQIQISTSSAQLNFLSCFLSACGFSFRWIKLETLFLGSLLPCTIFLWQ